MAAPTKTCIAYDNRMRQSEITSFSIAGFTEATGYPVENLWYDNPHQILKVTATPSSTPTIVVNFNEEHSFTAFGLFAHNLNSGTESLAALYSGYAAISLDYDDDSPNGDWTNVLTAPLTGMRYDENPDMLFIEGSSSWGTSDRWRIQFEDTLAGLYPFRLGGVFLGQHYELENEMDDGGFISTLKSDIIYSRSRHVRHVASFPSKPLHDGKLTVSRETKAQCRMIDYIHRANLGRIVGVKSGEQIAVDAPQTTEHFFGRIAQVQSRPRIGWPAVMDTVIDLEGL